MTTTTTTNQTLGTSLIALQNIAASTVVVGSEVSVANKFAGLIAIHFGRVTTSAPTAGVTFRIEVCPIPTGTIGANVASQWYPIAAYTTGIVAAIGPTVSATSGKTLTVSAVTSLAAQDVNVVSSNSAAPTLANTEWFRTVSAVSTTVTAEENFKNSYSTGSMWSKAEIATIPVDLTTAQRLRVVVDGGAHNQAFLTEVYMETFDNMTNV